MIFKNLAFAKFGDNLVFFYNYNPNPFNPGEIFYTIYSTVDNRVVEVDNQIRLENTTPTGMYALTVGSDLWLGASYANKIRVVKFDPLQTAQSDHYENSITGIQRFKLYKDRVFYTTDGTTIRSVVYNPTATDRALTTDLEISDLRDSSATSRAFSNQVLYDFHDWTEFSYRGDNYKIIWSVNTGYFLLNRNNRLTAHLYANLLPETQTTPPRVKYSGDAVVEGNKVYVPILRSGQREVLNRNAVIDEILPEGRQELVSFRPLGLELLVFDMESPLYLKWLRLDDKCLSLVLCLNGSAVHK